jgi:hypothetical protein
MSLVVVGHKTFLKNPSTSDQTETTNTSASLPDVSTQPVSILFEQESEEEEPLYIVTKVLIYTYRSDGQREYLLPWKRYSNNNDLWEPYGNFNQSFPTFCG